MQEFSQYAEQHTKVLNALDLNFLDDAIKILCNSIGSDGVIWVIGNGGSASTASHASCDLSKGLSLSLGRRVRSFSLLDSQATFTAWSNDFSYEDALQESCKINFRENDCLIVISGSGNSTNIVRAVEFANQMDVPVISLLGFDGGLIAKISKTPLIVKSDDMQIIENTHLTIVHWLLKAVTLRIGRGI
jgi:D-sedoheptulose 7-phosphate isomerase